MKKKLVMGMMSAVLMAGMVLPVHAANTTDGKMDVNYTEANVYVISIPQSVTLQQGTEVTAQIKATSMNVEPKKEVQVKVKTGIDNGAVSLTLDEGGAADKVTSTVSLTSGGAGIDSSTVVAKFSGQKKEPADGTGTLYFAGLKDDMKAGSWSGQLTFEVSLAEVTP